MERFALAIKSNHTIFMDNLLFTIRKDYPVVKWEWFFIVKGFMDRTFNKFPVSGMNKVYKFLISQAELIFI